MKKLFLLFCLICSLSSCSTYTIANITTFKPNGEILCEYKNIYLNGSEFKRYGFEFYDGARYVVLPNSLPYIIQYIHFEYCVLDGNQNTRISYDIEDYQ